MGGLGGTYIIRNFCSLGTHQRGLPINLIHDDDLFFFVIVNGQMYGTKKRGDEILQTNNNFEV